LPLARVGHFGLGDALHFERQNVSYFGLIGIIAVDGFCWVMLFEDVFRKFSFSTCAVAFMAASAEGSLAVSDNPHASGVEGEAWSPALTRHRSLILSTAERVVKYLPAMSSASSFPLAIIRRNAEAFIPPSGNAIFTASARSIGVVGVGTCPMESAVRSAVNIFLGGPESAAPHRR